MPRGSPRAPSAPRGSAQRVSLGTKSSPGPHPQGAQTQSGHKSGGRGRPSCWGSSPLDHPGAHVPKGIEWRSGQTVLSAFCRSPARHGPCLVAPAWSPQGSPLMGVPGLRPSTTTPCPRLHCRLPRGHAELGPQQTDTGTVFQWCFFFFFLSPSGLSFFL